MSGDEQGHAGEGTYWHGQFESAMRALADLRREHIETVAEIERLRAAVVVLSQPDPHGHCPDCPARLAP